MTRPDGVAARHERAGPVEVVGFSRPRVDEAVCGDAFEWHLTPELLTVLVADGLGHGGAAQEAAERAVACLRAGPTLAPDLLVRRCHVALGRTRGAAVAVLQLHTKRMQVTFCGVGNVAVREVPHRGGRGTSLPGIVGFRLPSLRVYETKLLTDDVLVIHSDGMPTGFDLSCLRQLSFANAPREMVTRHGLRDDDATVVTVRVHSPGKEESE